jgi:hypothetical protein
MQQQQSDSKGTDIVVEIRKNLIAGQDTVI